MRLRKNRSRCSSRRSVVIWTWTVAVVAEAAKARFPEALAKSEGETALPLVVW